MKHNKKSINKGLIVLNKGERIAVISLLVIIAILLAFSVFRPALHLSEEDFMAFHNLDSLIALQEEAARKQTENTTEPTTEVTSTTARTGFSSPNSNNAPAKIPSSKSTPSEHNFSKKGATAPPPKKIPVLEINSTDSLALVELPQIGEVMASRIHRYRDRLGGFVSIDQLYEVKGMDSARFATIQPYLLLDTTGIRKMEINRDEFKTLLRHPYLEYEQVKAIVNHRERKGLIRNWEQLKGIVGEVNPLLEWYVRY